jgi:L-serine deaminase
MAADGVYSVTLDEAIEAMRLTAADMSVKYKETSLSVCPGFPSVAAQMQCV